MFPDEATTSLCAWNSRNASRKHLLSLGTFAFLFSKLKIQITYATKLTKTYFNLGHNGPVRHISHSPTTAAFLTCSDDFRARFWSRRAPTH